jgi:hypothetical protein
MDLNNNGNTKKMGTKRNNKLDKIKQKIKVKKANLMKYLLS